jgi:hypothetical protein
LEENSMGLFSSIRDKIFGKKRQADQGGHPGQTGNAASAGSSAQTPQQQQQQQGQQPYYPQDTVAATQSVDVGAVLSEMASAKGGGGNYKTSIVDLLKLLDLDSGLGARKELAEELGVNAGENGSAEQNIALHKAVMEKLAANGGIVPDDLRN